MNAPIVLAASAVLFLASFAPAAEPSGTPEPAKLTTLDGASLFGIIEVTDDYTVRVKSDTGIQKIPLALLGESDFKKYGFGKDRSQDGKFWSERQNALESQKDSGPAKGENEDGTWEIRLAELAPFQPLIDAYEKSIAEKNSNTAADKNASEDRTAQAPFRALFSQPGVPGSVPQPFSGLGSSAVQPATSIGAGAVQSVGGATGIPTLP
ncbi:MAG TPA: hypothetical protein PLS03_07475 [Terrimicrobiaceae bacterium]|nr:hypothetical protein [Terrimicrobiaceae bacterium]